MTARSGRVRARALACALALVVALIGGSASANDVTQQPTGAYPEDGATPDDGYLLLPEDWATTVKLRVDHGGVTPEASDAVKLRYQVRPKKTDRERDALYPAVLVFQSYTHRTQDVAPVRALEQAGYVVVAVTARGSACSSGRFDLFSPTDAKDVAAAIHWITEREWSDGRVALIGNSYAAVEALVAAPERPPGLRAVSVAAPMGDLYRDVAHPGGILNHGTAAAYSAHRTVTNTAAQNDFADDEVCRQNHANRALDDLASPALTFPQHPEDDDYMRARSPIRQAHRIEVPVQMFVGWHDQTLGSRSVEILERLEVPYHAILTNGGHSAFDGSRQMGRVVEAELIPFLDHYVKGEANGYQDRPAVRVFWDTALRGSTLVPAWSTAMEQWPPRGVRPMKWHLAAGGRLDSEVQETGADVYRYVPGSGQSIGPERRFDHPSGIWQRRPAPGTSVVYTTPPLSEDLSVVGAASLDLWLSSTGPDADVQVVLTEVRPDGQEVYVQRGWLRASHRELDADLSTMTRPYHLHQPSSRSGSVDAPLGPVEMRVEIRPFGHVFREGSRIRVYIEAPSLVPDSYSFAAQPNPETNTIHRGPRTPSRLVLPVLPGLRAEASLPGCGVPLEYHCRPAAP